MADQIYLQENGKSVTISHPDKVLIHQANLTKFDLAEYYRVVAKNLLNYAQERPLSVVRYPNGFPGKSFFQRNKPAGAPGWIHSVKLGVEKKADYILPDKLLVLWWLVNLDCLEFHAAQVTSPDFRHPNMMVFDLDPPPKQQFSELRDFACQIKPIIESYGYHTFVKTSGKRGLHIYCPIKSETTFDQVFIASKQIALEIIQKFPESTLALTKAERQNKILIDVYRNHSFQSMVLPFSVRANSAASVSMPLSWQTLETLATPLKYTVKTVPDLIANWVDPWQNITDATIGLHRD